MRGMDFALIALVMTCCILSAGCTQSLQPTGSTSTPTTTQDAFGNIGSLSSTTNIVFFVMVLIIVAFIWYLVWTFVHR